MMPIRVFITLIAARNTITTSRDERSTTVCMSIPLHPYPSCLTVPPASQRMFAAMSIFSNQERAPAVGQKIKYKRVFVFLSRVRTVAGVLICSAHFIIGLVSTSLLQLPVYASFSTSVRV